MGTAYSTVARINGAIKWVVASRHLITTVYKGKSQNWGDVNSKKYLPISIEIDESCHRILFYYYFIKFIIWFNL